MLKNTPLINELHKAIQYNNDEKDSIEKQISELQQKYILAEERIKAYEQTLNIALNDRSLKNDKKPKRVKVNLFNTPLKEILSQVLKENSEQWLNINVIYDEILSLDSKNSGSFDSKQAIKIKNSIRHILKKLAGKGLIVTKREKGFVLYKLCEINQ